MTQPQPIGAFGGFEVDQLFLVEQLRVDPGDVDLVLNKAQLNFALELHLLLLGQVLQILEIVDFYHHVLSY